MNWKYSIPVSMSGALPAFQNIQAVVGIAKTSATVSWLELRSHQCEVAGINGKTAMQASIVTNGISDHKGYSKATP